jgi:glycosyltransferase involved in cell wall biosynthesis
MRILQIISGLSQREGGPAEACLQLSYELARQGEDVAIYTTHCTSDGFLGVSLNEPHYSNGVEIRYFGTRIMRSLRFSLSLAQALEARIPDCDVVHINSLYRFPSSAAAFYCRRYRTPYMLRPHGSLNPFVFRRHRLRKAIYEQLFDFRSLEHASAVHFTSMGEKNLASRLNLKIKPVIVPLGVRLEQFDGGPPRGAFRAVWPELGDKIVLLFLGRINFKKGLGLLVKAFGEIARRRDDVHLVIAGPDDEGYGTRVRKWLEAEGVLAKSTFTGMLVGEQKISAYRDADLFVLPSYDENFGIAVAEAMASGLPVVISNRVNICREIEEAQAGLVVDCAQHQLTSALLQLIDDPNARIVAGAFGRRLIEARFTWKTVAEQMIQVYRSVSGARRERSESCRDP